MNESENPAAFPLVETEISGVQFGMTLRDYFAAKAMQSFLLVDALWSHEEAADFAYKMADAMLKERNKS